MKNIFIALMFIVLCGCTKDEDAWYDTQYPIVTNYPSANSTFNDEFQLKGVIISGDYSEVGFVVSDSPINSDGDGTFIAAESLEDATFSLWVNTINNTSLQNDTKYYAQAYGHRPKGTDYGKVITVTTLADDVLNPLYTDNGVVESDINARQAIICATLDEEDGAMTSQIQEYGVNYWTIDGDIVGETVTESVVITSDTTLPTDQTFRVLLERLNPEQNYGYEFFSRSRRDETVYEGTFETNAIGTIVVTTDDLLYCAGSVASVTATVNDNGGDPYLEVGFYITGDGISEDEQRISVSSSGTYINDDTFSYLRTNLTKNTQYTVKAYVKSDVEGENEVIDSVGKTFTTEDLDDVMFNLTDVTTGEGWVDPVENIWIINSVESPSSSAFEPLRELLGTITDRDIEIIMPDLTSAVYGSFKTFTPVTSFILPALTNLMGGNFNGCTSLTTLSLPEVSELEGTYAFANCTILVSVDMPKLTSTSVVTGTFTNCNALTTVNMGGTYETDKVVMPNITTIDGYGFNNCYVIESVDLSSVTEIGTYAFNNCKAITSVSSSSVTNIGERAFNNCSAITSVNADNLLTIGTYAFNNCSEIGSVSSSSVTNIETYAFTNCSKITSVNADNLLTIGDYAFNNCSLLDTISAEKLKTIGASSFNNCSTLTELVFPSLKTIDNTSFTGCTGVTKISFAAMDEIDQTAIATTTLTNLDTLLLPSVTSFDTSYLSTNNAQLVEVDLSSATEDLPNNLFQNTTSIVSFSHGTSTTGTYVFGGCTSLKTISLPNVESLGNNAFNGCSNLETVSVSSVSSLGASAFQNCTSLESISLPSVESITLNNVFNGCSKLTSVDLSGLSEWTGTHTFANCSLLESLNLPELSSTAIVSNAFLNCVALKSLNLGGIYEAGKVVMPSSVTEIGTSAFSGCTLLATISADDLETIGISSFNNCTSLTELVFPSLKTIDDTSFTGCTGVTKISFAAMETISQTAIATTTLTDLNTLLLPSVTTFDTSYLSTNNTQLVEVDLSSATNDLTANLFQNSTSIVSFSHGASNTTGVNNMFNGCANLETVSLPKIKSFGTNAFQNCTSLKTISLPEVTTFSTSAFYGCTNLETVSLPNVTEFGNNTFRDCTSLKTINSDTEGTANIAGVTTLGTYVFYYCYGIDTILAPDVSSVGNNAFRNCTSLTTMTLATNATTFTGGTNLFTNDTATTGSSVDIAGQTTLTTKNITGNISVSGNDWTYNNTTTLTFYSIIVEE